MSHLSGRCILSLCGAALVSSLIIGCAEETAQVTPRPPDVEVVTVQQRDVPIYHDWVCTLSASVNATISAQVTGYLVAQKYREGAIVKAGQVLFQIDPSSFQAALLKAQAQVEEAQARETKNEQDVQRYTPLAASEAISKQELDDAIQAEKASKAQVDGAKAALTEAQLSLAFTSIASPVDGVAGIAKAQIGDLVGPASGALTTVVKVKPMRAYFSVSQDLVAEIMERRLAAGQELDSGEGPSLQLFLAGGRAYPEEGKVSFHDNQVDPKTGTVTMIGEFPNAKGVLVSGMFGRIKGLIGTDTDALLVPTKAVAEMQGRNLVAIVDLDNKVSIQLVTVGAHYGSQSVITGDVKAGDRVVVEGLQKVRDGLVVNPIAPQVPASAAMDAITPATDKMPADDKSSASDKEGTEKSE